MDQSPTRSRRVRRSKVELRELVLGSGIEVLHAEGLGTGVENLTFKKVLDHLQESSGIRITPASLIRRVWQDQKDFQFDVVRTIITEQGEGEIGEVSDSLSETFARLDLSSPKMRRASLDELIRVASKDYLSTTISPLSTIQTALASYALAGGDAGVNQEFLGLFSEATALLTRQYVEIYELALEAVGFRIRPGLRIEQMAVAILSFGEGSLLRRSTAPEAFAPMFLPREIDGASVEWDLFGFGVKAIVEAFTEEDPDWAGHSD
ncbi:MAG: hypothetical protein WCI12_02385 [Actinomycetes bacterium]